MIIVWRWCGFYPGIVRNISRISLWFLWNKIPQLIPFFSCVRKSLISPVIVPKVNLFFFFFYFQVFADCLAKQTRCKVVVSNKRWFSFFMDLYVTQMVVCPQLNYSSLVARSRGKYVFVQERIFAIIFNLGSLCCVQKSSSRKNSVFNMIHASALKLQLIDAWQF